MKIKTFNKEGKELLKNLDFWSRTIDDKRLLVYVARELRIAYMDGICKGLETAREL